MDSRSKDNMEMMTEKQLISKYNLQCASIDSDIIIPHDLFYIITKEFCECGYVIKEITWWEHRSLESKSTISMGGPLDKNDPSFFWGETDISISFESNDLTENVVEVKRYYQSFMENEPYSNLLTPAITVKKYE